MAKPTTVVEEVGRERGTAPKSLFRKVERTLDAIDQGEDILATVTNVARHMVGNFQDDLGILGGRIYRLNDDNYELVRGFGTAQQAPVGALVSRHYAAIEAVLDSGILVMDRNAPELDPGIEAQLGTRERFAAIAVADGDYVISFDVKPGRGAVEDLRASLNIVRLAINQKLRQEKFEELLQEARRIQGSILPKRTPRYGDFDIAADSRPAQVVGGDFYDFIPVTPEMFDLAVADASGHGLPAALQVRDVYMGLRMGLTRDFKVSRTVERRTFPAGTLWVPADQPDFEVAAQLLEADGPDSLFAWGLLDSVVEQKEWIDTRNLERVAKEMLAADPALAAEWAKALQDEAFAKDAQARRTWWYRRTPYWSVQEVGLLPAFRVLRVPSELR